MLFATFVLAWCMGTNTLQTMSLEEKVGQVLMVHFHGETANEEAKTLIQETNVGAIIYYNWSNGLHSPEQIRNLSAGLQKLAEENRIPIPLLIATDQEGGRVTRLKDGFTSFPANQALGLTQNPDLAEAAAQATGEELQAVGINMNLAPVVDINSNPRNIVIGDRSFGSDPQTVVAFGEKALNGYKRAGVISTLKHFPGYGDISIDPHEDLPIIYKSKAELEQIELRPFAQLAQSADAIMTAHILIPAFDAENCSTLSKKTLDYLKNDIGFQGVIVADSLMMRGVLKKCKTADEAAILALSAGCDLLILGGRQLVGKEIGFELTMSDMQRIHRSIVNAVKMGRVSEERLDQAVSKILTLKEPLKDVASTANLPDHREIAQRIASLVAEIPQENTHRE